jgi:organic hydroperoxide reductase OsmC/OhrA
MASFSRSAVLQWDGEVMDGAGQVTAGSNAFAVAVTFPSTGGDPSGKTTPEELLAASHATCYGIERNPYSIQRQVHRPWWLDRGAGGVIPTTFQV